MTTHAFICDAVRTPVGRYGGALAAMRTDDLAAVPLAALLARNPRLDAAAIDDVILGCANQAGEDNRNIARMALLLAGWPVGVPGSTLNRLCGSGLDAVAGAARAIRSGDAQLLVAGGVESMTRAPFVMPKAGSAFARDPAVFDTTVGWRLVNPRMKAAFGTDAMPETAENLAAELGIARADQDAYALRSQQRYAAAAARIAQEIVPVPVPGARGAVSAVERDEHPRATTLEQLAQLRPIVRPDGTVTAGNASGVNDGAAALLLASEAAAARHGLVPRARVVASAVAGVPPRTMGIGPVPATHKLLALTGVALAEIEVIEINEAFAAQVLACTRGVGLPDDAAHVNADGGAIAIGHPLGMSGARLAATAVRRLHEQGARYALVTLCIGVGQGIAVLLERV